MGQNIEPKMDELKKLLRRLDGLDNGKGLVQTAQESATEQRGYVGALRGTPQHGEDEERGTPRPASEPRSVASVLWAAAAAALVSSVAAYLVISNNTAKVDLRSGAPGASGYGQPAGPTSMQDGLIRSAERLLDTGDVEAGRALLQKAAELGSGEAALKLGRSYDPTQPKQPNFADSQTNLALAKAWYERALALGTREAAAHIQQPRAR